ncbi:alpha/beta hydrolase family protein [Catenovulum sediminis]|uniref:Prolyl oligopeptidase family serine peptidase n=1 Tax=Catenovulum sediminis TaxID=1740262 RepID=A0ABV1RF72_9ALTE|nr:prolyl oligopeptidase family serine peptidase [Catenovulum sediminis]
MDKLKRYTFCFLLFLLFSGHTVANERGLLEKIISSASIKHIRMSPDGQHAAFTTSHEDEDYIAVFSLSNFETSIVHNLPKGQRIQYARLAWIDNKHLYLQYAKSDSYKAKHKKYLYEISDDLSIKEHGLHVPGYLVDPLARQSGQLIYAHYQYERLKYRLKLFRATPQDLIRNNFSQAYEYQAELKDVLRYSTDEQHNLRFAQSNDRKSVEHQFWFLDEDEHWQKLYKTDVTRNTFKPIAIIDANTALVLSNVVSDKVALWRFDIAAQRFVESLYQHPEYDLVGVSLTKTDQQLRSVSYYQDGLLKVDYFDESVKQRLQLVTQLLNDGSSYIVSADQNEDNMVLFHSDSNFSGAFYLLPDNSDLPQLLAHRYAQHGALNFNKSELREFKNADGQTTESYYLPAKTGVLEQSVLLVVPHGGPIGVRDSRSFNAQLQYLSQLGFASLQVNFRGSIGYGKRFMDAGRGQFGEMIEQDVMAALHNLLKTESFDKICSLGSSYGGYSASMLAILHPDVFDCVVARFGVYDLHLLYSDVNYKQGELYQKRVHQVVGDPNIQKSPVYLADKLNVPVLLTAGAKDKIARPEHTWRFQQMLTQHKKQVEMKIFDKAGHGHQKKEGLRAELALITDFLMRQLTLNKVH